MNEYIIKIAETEEEINGRGYVHYQSWQETYTGLIDSTYLEKMTLENCTKIAHKFADNILVAKDKDRVIGFVAYGEYRDNTLPDCGEVSAIYVLNEYQGKKIVFALMNAAIEKLSSYQNVVLWVLKGNDKAIRFYEKYGFVCDGTERAVVLGTPHIELRMTYKPTVFHNY